MQNPVRAWQKKRERKKLKKNRIEIPADAKSREELYLEILEKVRAGTRSEIAKIR